MDVTNNFDISALDGMSFEDLKTQAKTHGLRNLPVDPNAEDLKQSLKEFFAPKRKRGKVARVPNEQLLEALQTSNLGEEVLEKVGLEATDKNRSWLYAAIQRLKGQNLIDKSFSLQRGSRKGAEVTRGPTHKQKQTIAAFNKVQSAEGTITDLLEELGIPVTSKDRAKMSTYISILRKKGMIEGFLVNARKANVVEQNTIVPVKTVQEQEKVLDQEVEEALTELEEAFDAQDEDDFAATDLTAAV